MKTNLTTEKILDKKFEKDVKGYKALAYSGSILFSASI